jgi:hypothetical protein
MSSTTAVNYNTVPTNKSTAAGKFVTNPKKNLVSGSQEDRKMISLRNQLADAQNEYNKHYKILSNNVQNYFNRIDPKKDSYLNQNISLSNGQTSYITNQGVSKLYNEKSFPGKNGCPTQIKKIQGINDPTKLKPNLKVGNPISGNNSYQCGNEGKNVMVSSILPTSKPLVPTEKGCYSSVSKSSQPMDYLDSNGKITKNKPGDMAKIYTYDTCMANAIYQGQRYFALQDAVATNGTGYCAVSNTNSLTPLMDTSRRIDNTSYINPPGGQRELWSSKIITNFGPSKLIGTQMEFNNLGGLVIKDANGGIVKNIIASSSTTYMGCFLDNKGVKRNLPQSSGRGKTQNYSTCQSLAKSRNLDYFGLQNETGIGKSAINAECWMGNEADYTRTLKDKDFPQLPQVNTQNKNFPQIVNQSKDRSYNCHLQNDGYVYGGPSVNSIYKNSPPATYFLIINDNGTIAMYKGNYIPTAGSEQVDSKNTKMWSAGKAGTSMDPNATYSASASKYGNCIVVSKSSPSVILRAGEFIGSLTGKAYLKMENDGNLVLYTSKREVNCKIKNNRNVGGVNANAIYDIGMYGYPRDLARSGFVDENGTLREYPSNMILNNSKSEYIVKKGRPITMNNQNIQNFLASNTQYKTLNAAKSACNSNSKCYSIFENNEGIFYLTTNKYGEPTITDKDSLRSQTHFRKPQINSSGSCPKGFVEIDSLAWERYAKNNGGMGNLMTDKFDCNFGQTKLTDAKLELLKENVDKLTKKIQESSKSWVRRSGTAQNNHKGNKEEDKTNTGTNSKITVDKDNEKDAVTQEKSKKQNKSIINASSNIKKKSGGTTGRGPVEVGKGNMSLYKQNKTNHRYHKVSPALNTNPEVRIKGGNTAASREKAPINAGPVAPRGRGGRDGFTNMNSVINRIVNDSSMLVSQKNYEYILWVVLAVLAIAIFIRVRRK